MERKKFIVEEKETSFLVDKPFVQSVIQLIEKSDNVFINKAEVAATLNKVAFSDNRIIEKAKSEAFIAEVYAQADVLMTGKLTKN